MRSSSTGYSRIFEQLVYEQAEKRDYNAILPPRSEVVEKLDKSASCLYFVDAMGVEYLSWIMQKAAERNFLQM